MDLLDIFEPTKQESPSGNLIRRMLCIVDTEQLYIGTDPNSR